MAQTLRDLLIQRAARLQERPALTAPDWGTLSYGQLRNRVEGIALGLLAQAPPPALFVATGTAWDWAAEVAVAICGKVWDPGGQPLSPEVLGGSRFNDEAGRGPYHALEHTLHEATPFQEGLTQGQWLTRLRRWNDRQGWDHDTHITLPLARLGDPSLRAALWCVLYAGGHGILAPPSRHAGLPAWDPSPFQGLWTQPS